VTWKHIEAGDGGCCIGVKSIATTPDQITEQWRVHDDAGWHNAPNLRVWVCSSVEKHAAEQRVEEEQAQAMVQAQQLQHLVLEGLANDGRQIMGVYELVEGKMVNGRAVRQKQGGDEDDTCLYYSGVNAWRISSKQQMETDSDACFLCTLFLQHSLPINPTPQMCGERMMARSG
jgi:hypothetical protein